jgi:hypothetical protein
MKRFLLLGCVALALTGCGARRELKPAAEKPLPVKPYDAKATPTPNKLLEAPPQTRPERSDNLIESSKERRSDEFDLPPPE